MTIPTEPIGSIPRPADTFLEAAQRYASAPVKQAVISPSALNLMYPADGLRGYTREQFIDDLLREHDRSGTFRFHRRCFDLWQQEPAARLG